MAPSGTLGQVLDRFGLTLLGSEVGQIDRGRRVNAVVLHDSVDPQPVPQDAIVLGVGVHTADQVVELVDEAGRQGACALVLREPVPSQDRIRAAADRHELALLTLVKGVSWIQIADVLMAPRAEEWSAVTGTGQDLDLFEVANSLSAVLNAPVTIEDLTSRILAFSADQGESDEARKASVLGHQVPRTYNDPLIKGGVFRRLYAASEPIFVPSIAEGMRPRAAVRVCAGEEVLGSIWAVVDQPLDSARAAAMAEAANVAALAMLRTRVAADASRRMRLATVTALIGGGPPAREAASTIHGPMTGGCVLAAARGGTRVPGDEASTSAEMERVAGALLMLLRSEFPSAVAAAVEETVYAVLPSSEAAPLPPERVQRLTHDFAHRMGRRGEGVLIGIGSSVPDVRDLDQSRREADLTLRVLRSPTADVGRSVALASDVRVESMLLRLSDLLGAGEDAVGGPIAQLRGYDEEHGSMLEETLREWLDHFGDVSAAATAVHVHKNTFRYRLGRVVELTGIDLDDADERFHLMLQFRLAAYADSSSWTR